MWKDFFYYTKSERIATITIAVILLILIAVRVFIVPQLLPEEQDLTDEERQRIDSLLRQIDDVTQPTKFDPWRADSLTLMREGLSPITIRNLIDKRKTCKNRDEFDAFFIETIVAEKPDLLKYISQQP